MCVKTTSLQFNCDCSQRSCIRPDLIESRLSLLKCYAPYLFTCLLTAWCHIGCVVLRCVQSSTSARYPTMAVTTSASTPWVATSANAASATSFTPTASDVKVRESKVSELTRHTACEHNRHRIKLKGRNPGLSCIVTVQLSTLSTSTSPMVSEHYLCQRTLETTRRPKLDTPYINKPKCVVKQ